MDDSVEMQNSENLEDRKHGKNNMELVEDALVACGFGKFHVWLLFGNLATSFSTMLVTWTIAFILPIAECDLNMKLVQKGMLSSMPFFGQVASSLFVGFLIDTFGRKTFLVSGLLGTFVCQVIGASSQHIWTLACSKLFEGIFLPFYFPASSVMLSEMVHKDLRTKVLLLKACITTLATMCIPLIAWAVLPHKLDVVISEGYFELHSWNFFLLVSSVWSLIGGVIFYYLPESPKYLLSHGQEDKALDVLKHIYTINTGNHNHSFPIKFLKDDSLVPKCNLSLKTQIERTLFEVKNLFKRPLIGRLLKFCTVSSTILVSFNGLRIWFPQILTIVENYEKTHNNTDYFSNMLTDYMDSMKDNKIKMAYSGINVTTNETLCVPHLSGSETYTNGIILGFTTFIGMSLSICLIDIIGHKLLMFLFLLLCASCSSALYWTNSMIEIAVLLSVICGFLQTSLNLQMNIFIRAFPTTLRSLSNTIIVMAGRIGSLVGSLLFPLLLSYGSMVPFVVLSLLTLFVASFVYFLPKPDNQNGDK